MAHHANSDTEIETLINTYNGLILIDAFATWCGPCRVLAPKLDMLAQKYPHIRIIKVDIDELSNFADMYDITAMPTILFVKKRNIVARVEGANLPLIEKNIEKYM